MLKELYRQSQDFVKTLAEIHETVKSINAIQDEWNKESVTFWTEFKKDFPEMNLDTSKLKSYANTPELN